MTFSGVIFLFIVMFSFGYIAQTIRQFNFWRFLLISSIVIIFFNSFGSTKGYLAVMMVSFFIGYLLPRALVLKGLGKHISEVINNIRYRDAYEEIKRKEEEVEELRKQYEKARAEASREKHEQEKQSRRQKQKESSQQKKQKSSKQSKQQQSSTSYGSPKAKYLNILALDPSKDYRFEEIKKAYRRQASKYHPDKHYGKDNYRDMEERFKKVQEAFSKLSETFAREGREKKKR